MIKDRIQKVLDEYKDMYEVDPISSSHLDRLTGMLQKEFIGDGKKCGVCEASLKAYWHKLTPLLVNSLVKMRDRVCYKGINKVHIRTELSLSKSEYNNFQKLRFHGLIAHYEKNGVREDGYWLLTRRAGQFLHGEIAVPARVKTFRNRVIEHDKKCVYIKSVIGTTPFLEEKDSIAFDFMLL